MDQHSDGRLDARADALFDELLDLEAPKEREAHLAEIARDEPELAQKVRRLLALVATDEADTLERGLEEFWGSVLDEASSSPAAHPDAVGPWQLERELGRGGMGAVYLGRRADGEFQQKAAIKLVHAGHDESILRRFELERQILAGLRHPNIAQLLDGGRTTGGQPYFAMEYVQGRTILEYSDEKRLTVGERLGLFLQVGQAVGHAHKRLVIHRDLKPSNIVVTEAGEVKLLDFGIAKLLGPKPLGATPLTGVWQRMLTPEYASPEQIEGATITTASDVYQLGLLLYELLTGQHPFRGKAQNLRELERVVREQSPTTPSTLVGSDSVDSSVAWARRTQRSTLSRRLHGDLDNIVLMALAREPEGRYASVSQLLDDIERHLAGLPVSARAPTFLYRAGKFLRRHKLAVAAALAFLALLVGYAATVTVQERQIRQERDRAEIEAARANRVKDFLVGLFEAADPYRHRGEELTASELLDAGATSAREELADEPEVLSEMLVVLGSVSANLGAYERSEALLEQGLALREELYEEPHPAVASAKLHLAIALREQGDTERSYQLTQEALSAYRRLYPEEHPEVAVGLLNLGLSELVLGNLEAAESLYRQSLAIWEALGRRDGMTARTLNDLGSILQRQGRHPEAEEHHRRALSLRRFLYTGEHHEISESLNNLAVTLRQMGRLDEAEPLLREALAVRRKVFGERHLRVSNTLNNLGELQRRRKRFDEAEKHQREALSIRREVLGDHHRNVALSLHNLGVVLRDAGRFDEAEQSLTDALEMFRETLPVGHHLPSFPATALGILLLDQGRLSAASVLLEEALALRLDAFGELNDRTAETRLILGLCRHAEGRRVEAREHLEAGLATLDQLEHSTPEELMERARLALTEVTAAD